MWIASRIASLPRKLKLTLEIPPELRARGSSALIQASAWMKSTLDLRVAITCLGGFFLLGLIFLTYLPETQGEDLPE